MRSPSNNAGFSPKLLTRELDIAANALSTNRDTTKVAVAGRNLLKIFSVDESSFVEEHNLKVGKQATLNFSSLDVAWSPIEDHIIASAATNGAVVLWNLNKVAKNKAGFELSPDTTYQVHKRTVNKVAFHQTDASSLLSGSQDATIKLFDLRKRTPVQTFENGTDSVRDIQFSPHFATLFVAADEAGNVKCWDLRNPERPLKQFAAHTGPLLSLDFHPTGRNWVASGGRDKLIKVWDISSDKPHVVYSVQTIAPVNKVKWRPSREWHIASCSLVIDCSIHIWDIRRPFMPFASFEDHKDVTTGIAWRQDAHTFLSCGKDGLLIQHSFREASRPADFANPVGLDVGPYGDIACAFSNDILQSSLTITTSSSNVTAAATTATTTAAQKQQQKQSEQFRAPHTSSLYVNMLVKDNDKRQFSMDWFIETALRYHLSGKSMTELCLHNAKIAFTLNRPQVATTWMILQSLYDSNSTGTTPAAVFLSNIDSGESYNTSGVAAEHLLSASVGAADGTTKNHAAGASSGEKEQLQDEDILGGLDFPRSQKTSTATTMGPWLPSNMNADLFFGDGELGKIVFDEFEALRAYQNTENDWKLQQEAFEPRPDFLRTNSDLGSDAGGGAGAVSTGAQDDFQQNQHQQQPSSSGGSPGGGVDGSGNGETAAVSSSSAPKSAAARPQHMLHVSNSQGRRAGAVRWHFHDLVARMLRFYADNGDVQMAASVLLVLGPSRSRCLAVDDATQRMWFSAYIEMLDRFQLCAVAAWVIRLCPLPEISSMSQDSTMLTLTCGSCEKPTSRGGWWCDRCRRTTSVCSVCNHSAKGLYVWCYGCGHGGHLLHMRNWFQKNIYCPTGCGHICEFS